MFIQAAALSVIPVEKLEKNAKSKFDKALSLQPGLNQKSYRDFLLSELKEWFKDDFFRWVDTPNCPNCGQPTQASG